MTSINGHFRIFKKNENEQRMNLDIRPIFKKLASNRYFKTTFNLEIYYTISNFFQLLAYKSNQRVKEPLK